MFCLFVYLGCMFVCKKHLWQCKTQIFVYFLINSPMIFKIWWRSLEYSHMKRQKYIYISQKKTWIRVIISDLRRWLNREMTWWTLVNRGKGVNLSQKFEFWWLELKSDSIFTLSTVLLFWRGKIKTKANWQF